MITLDLTPELFAALRAGFEAGICEEGPIEQEMLAGLRIALAEAAATASRQSTVRVALESSYELFIWRIVLKSVRKHRRRSLCRSGKQSWL